MEFLNEWILPIILFWSLLVAVLILFIRHDNTIKWGADPSQFGAVSV